MEPSVGYAEPDGQLNFFKQLGQPNNVTKSPIKNPRLRNGRFYSLRALEHPVKLSPVASFQARRNANFFQTSGEQLSLDLQGGTNYLPGNSTPPVLPIEPTKNLPVPYSAPPRPGVTVSTVNSNTLQDQLLREGHPGGIRANPDGSVPDFVMSAEQRANLPAIIPKTKAVEGISSWEGVLKGGIGRAGRFAAAGAVGGLLGSAMYGALSIANPSGTDVNNVGTTAVKGGLIGAGIGLGATALLNTATKPITSTSAIIGKLGELGKGINMTGGKSKAFATAAFAIGLVGAGSFSMTKPYNGINGV